MRLNFINSDWFRKNKRSMMMSAFISFPLLMGYLMYEISDSRYLAYTAKIKELDNPNSCSCGYEPDNFGKYGIVDRIVWDDNYINDEAVAYCPNFLDTTTIKIIVYRGSSKVTHYRIKTSDVTPKWSSLPRDNTILFDLNDIPEEWRYGQYIEIQFGTFNPELGIIDVNNTESLIKSADSKEVMDEYEKTHAIIRAKARCIVDDDDTDFSKTRKIYDYLINHTEYRYSDEGIYEKSLFNKYYMDCAGYAEFLNIALNSVGVESFIAADNTHGHVWNIVKVDDKYYHIDATYSDTGSWYDTSRYRYFLVSDDFMLSDHRFFVTEKQVQCEETFDLTGLVSDYDVKHRGLIGEEINSISEGHKIGEISDSGYALKYRSK